MSDDSAPPPPERSAPLKNWLSLAGAITVAGQSVRLRFPRGDRHRRPRDQSLRRHPNLPRRAGLPDPRVAPDADRLAGAAAPGGRGNPAAPAPDAGHRPFAAAAPPLSQHLRRSGAAVFLLLTAFGSYQTYHFTESVTFCGETCHTVMQPEFTTYHHGSHARVSCAECHIGSGASWYVKSKISGAYQVYATTFNKYERPIKTPDPKPAPGPGDLRALPLAGEIHRQSRPLLRALPLGQEEHALHGPPVAPRRRRPAGRRASSAGSTGT